MGHKTNKMKFNKHKYPEAEKGTRPKGAEVEQPYKNGPTITTNKASYNEHNTIPNKTITYEEYEIFKTINAVGWMLGIMFAVSFPLIIMIFLKVYGWIN